MEIYSPTFSPQVAIGFSLTILLVMYTLYQGVIQSLPKTAYLKFIDVWLLFCLIIPITVFMVEVFWELHRVKKSAQEKKMKTLRPKRMSRNASLDLDQSQIPFQRLAQIGFIFVTVAFTMSYCLIAANYLNNPITAWANLLNNDRTKIWLEIFLMFSNAVIFFQCFCIAGMLSFMKWRKCALLTKF